MPNRTRPTSRAYIANLRKSMPLRRKLGLIARNAATRVVRLQSCCGHPGEPGC